MQRSCEPDQGRPLYVKTATKKPAEVCGYEFVVNIWRLGLGFGVGMPVYYVSIVE